MNTRLMVVAATLGAWLAGMTALQAADTWPVGKSMLVIGSPGNPALEIPIERVVRFGTVAGAMVIEPNTLTFDRNKLYRLVITNPSNMTHYVSVPEFEAAVQTKKLTVADFREPSMPLRSAHGTEGVTLNPGARLEWLFVAEQAGDFGIGCAIPGHAKAGMVGMVKIGS